jgi:hypothetical protein
MMNSLTEAESSDPWQYSVYKFNAFDSQTTFNQNLRSERSNEQTDLRVHR